MPGIVQTYDDDRHPRQGGATIRFALLSVGLSTLLSAGLTLAVSQIGIRSPSPAAKAGAPAAPARAKSASNQLVYDADRSGHFFVDAEVNGAPVRFLVDTGATVVALSPDDARAAGIARNSLRFADAVGTANGIARVARTTLRDVRLNQLAVEEVPAVVMEEPMSVSLLGMSFLSRLDGYSIRDGRLTIEW